MTRFRAQAGLVPWIAGICAVAGFYAIILGWRGAAGEGSLALQVPFVVSGAFGGLGLIVVSATLLHIDTWRRLSVEELEAMRDIVDSAARTTIALRDDGENDDEGITARG